MWDLRFSQKWLHYRETCRLCLSIVKWRWWEHVRKYRLALVHGQLVSKRALCTFCVTAKLHCSMSCAGWKYSKQGITSSTVPLFLLILQQNFVYISSNSSVPRFSREIWESRIWEWWILSLWSSVTWCVPCERVPMMQKNLLFPCTLNMLKMKAVCSSKMLAPLYRTTRATSKKITSVTQKHVYTINLLQQCPIFASRIAWESKDTRLSTQS